MVQKERYNQASLFDLHQDDPAFRYYLTRVHVNAMWFMNQNIKAIGWVIPKKKRKRRKKGVSD